MLISEKIQEIQELLTQTQSLSEANAQSFKESATKELKALISELESVNKENISQELEACRNSLLSQAERELREVIDTKAQELYELNKADMQNASETLKANNAALQESAQRELKAQLETEITNKLKEEVSSQIMQDSNFITQIENFTNEVLKNVAIDYKQFDIDLRALSEQVKAIIRESIFKDLQSENKQALKDLSTSEYAQELIKDTLKTNAREVWRESISNDTLIKERWEAKLRLESLNLLALQEGISDMLRQSTNKALREMANPPSSVDKQNILISK